MRTAARFILPALLLAACGGGSWRGALFLPTHIAKFGDTYFLVDCGHNRVLYSDSLETPIPRWNTLDGGLGGPHSIASDGDFFVVDDTGNHRLRVYRRAGGGFRLRQTVDGVGRRPHRVLYDPETRAFYAVASNSQTISKLSAEDGKLRLIYTRELPFLKGSYTRSASIINGRMFFVSGPGSVTEAEYRDDSFRVVKSYPVPEKMALMNDIARIGGEFWLTSTGPRPMLVRTKDLRSIGAATPDLRKEFGIASVPYYFSEMDGLVAVTQIGDTENSVVTFRLGPGGEPVDIRERWKSGPPSEASLKVRAAGPI